MPPVIVQLFEQALELDPRRTALDPERPRDIALGGQGRVVADPLQDIVFAGYLVHAPA